MKTIGYIPSKKAGASKTKKELLEEAETLGLSLSAKSTVDDITSAIETAKSESAVGDTD